MSDRRMDVPPRRAGMEVTQKPGTPGRQQRQLADYLESLAQKQAGVPEEIGFQTKPFDCVGPYSKLTESRGSESSGGGRFDL
jgi:hypothetical protein